MILPSILPFIWSETKARKMKSDTKTQIPSKREKIVKALNLHSWEFSRHPNTITNAKNEIFHMLIKKSNSNRESIRVSFVLQLP